METDTSKKSHLAIKVIALTLAIIVTAFLVMYAFGKMLSSVGNDSSNSSSGTDIASSTKNFQASENYLIKQKSSMPFSLSAPRGVMNAKSDINFITVGFPMSKAQSGKYGWQTDWKVIINSTSQLNTKTKIKDPNSGLHSSAVTGTFSPTNAQSIYYFSLANVKEGDTFDVRYQQMPIENATFHFNENNWIFYGKDDAPFVAVPINTSEQDAGINNNGNVSTLKAILVKDNGENGAIIGFKPVDYTKEQKAQLEGINQIVNQPGAPDMTQFWNGQVYPMLTNLPQQPPLKIVLQSGLPEKGYFEEEINNAEHVNAAPGADVSKEVNGDKNGDGVPDLVPLPSKK